MDLVLLTEIRSSFYFTLCMNKLYFYETFFDNSVFVFDLSFVGDE